MAGKGAVHRNGALYQIIQKTILTRGMLVRGVCQGQVRGGRKPDAACDPERKSPRMVHSDRDRSTQKAYRFRGDLCGGTHVLGQLLKVLRERRIGRLSG